MELDFIAWLREQLPEHPNLRLGPGDDAAILRWAGQGDCVVTTDLLTDGIHFQLDQAGAARVGRKAMAVNLSDLAAMAARPHSAVISLLLPRAGARQLAVQLYDGMLPLARRFDLAIAGGDTNCWDGPLAINVAAIGEVTDDGPLLRSGATPGDSIIVTGHFGGSILRHHYDFQPRVSEALLLNHQFKINAGIDVSDGLSLDLSRVCQESGCGAVIQLERIPISPDAETLASNEAEKPGNHAALFHALADGEDFELVMAVPPGEDERLLAEQPLSVPLTRIGHFIAGSGLWQQTDGRERQPLAVSGFQHGTK